MTLQNEETQNVKNFSPKVRSCYRVSILSNPANQKKILQVKKITKLPGNGIAESVKSCNLDQKGSFKA